MGLSVGSELWWRAYLLLSKCCRVLLEHYLLQLLPCGLLFKLYPLLLSECLRMLTRKIL